MKRKICLNGIKYISHDGTIHIQKNVNTIDDLIDLCDMYRPGKKYNINLEKLIKIKDILIKLQNTIGLNIVKKSIVNQIIYFLQDFKSEYMLHTVIQGPPGVGKTMLGQIIGEIYYKLDILKSEKYKFKSVKRTDLIGQYLGSTAQKTQKTINECEGGVMFIDEAYSLGNPEGRDSYSKECIDTINQNLTEKKQSFLCIIAGYKEALDKCFFAYNQGLQRRFPFVYTIEKYTCEELLKIFFFMLHKDNWKYKGKSLIDLFKNNYKHFDNMAGDMETLIFNTKLEHSKRVLCLHHNLKQIVSFNDVNNAIEIFKHNKSSIVEQDKPILSHMYM